MTLGYAFQLMEQYASQSNGYPEKFIFWLSGGNHPFVYWSDENGEYFTDEVSDRRWLMPKLYNYWLTNIKDK